MFLMTTLSLHHMPVNLSPSLDYQQVTTIYFPSPLCIALLDFDNATIRITFDPDEDAGNNERDAPIAITNDDINEAIEQVFVVHLVLVNSSNPSSIDLSVQATSLCRIIDDDGRFSEVLKYNYDALYYQQLQLSVLDLNCPATRTMNPCLMN